MFYVPFIDYIGNHILYLVCSIYSVSTWLEITWEKSRIVSVWRWLDLSLRGIIVAMGILILGPKAQTSIKTHIFHFLFYRMLLRYVSEYSCLALKGTKNYISIFLLIFWFSKYNKQWYIAAEFNFSVLAVGQLSLQGIKYLSDIGQVFRICKIKKFRRAICS